MNTTQLVQWLRDHSSGIYRPSRDAAELIEQLERENNQLRAYVAELEEQCDSIGLQKAQHAAGLAKA